MQTTESITESRKYNVLYDRLKTNYGDEKKYKLG